MTKRTLVLLLVLTLPSFGQSEPVCSSAPLTVNSTGEVFLEGKPYRGVGINYFNAFLRVLADPEDTSYREGFEVLGRHEIPFARVAAAPFYPFEWDLYKQDRDQFYERLDDVIASASAAQVGLVLSLNSWWPATIPDLVGEPLNQWGNPESKTIAWMQMFNREVVTRYRENPTIWMWEFGNELNLQADLHNPDHWPLVLPHWGTPETRSASDTLTHSDIVTAMRVFGETVRALDPDRPVATGHSLPRPSAHYLQVAGTWQQDSSSEFKSNLKSVNPRPMDVVTIHVYQSNHKNRFNQPQALYSQTIGLASCAAREMGQALFVGEFGAPDENGQKVDQAWEEIQAILVALDEHQVPLAALWNFDLKSQEETFSIRPDNHRAYLLSELQQINHNLRTECEEE